MTPEQSAWDNLRPVLVGLGLDPRRVENVLGPGHPDVNYAGGDIELKAMADWPARPSTPVKVPEFSGEQAGWLGQRWKAQGLSWLAVRLGTAWFLFDGWTALTDVYPGATRQQWHELALLVFPGFSAGVSGGRWNVTPARPGAHTYSRQLGDVLRYDLDRMQPWTRARAMRLRCFEGNKRCSVEGVAAALEWPAQRVLEAELGGGPAQDVDTLLSYWES